MNTCRDAILASYYEYSETQVSRLYSIQSKIKNKHCTSKNTGATILCFLNLNSSNIVSIMALTKNQLA